MTEHQRILDYHGEPITSIPVAEENIIFSCGDSSFAIFAAKGTLEKNIEKGKRRIIIIVQLNAKSIAIAGRILKLSTWKKQIEEQFKHIQFSQEFIDLVSQKVRKFYEEAKNGKENEKRILLNKKMAVEKKRDIAEEKLITGILANDDFVRIRDRYKQEIILMQNEIDILETQREMDTETVRKVLLISRDIYQAYKTAPYET